MSSCCATLGADPTPLGNLVELRSTLTCPRCGHQETETMPTDACQFFYDCKGCGVVLRPNDGDCCVFCSYGSVPCPPIQQARESGSAGKCRGQAGAG
jgi:hypothetical protein